MDSEVQFRDLAMQRLTNQRLLCFLFAGWWMSGVFSAPVLAQSSSSMFGNNSPSNRSASGMSSMGGNSFSGSSGGMGGSGGVFGSSALSGAGLSGGGNNRAGGNQGANQGANGRNGNAANQGNFIGRNIDPNQFIGGNNMIGGNQGQQNNRRQGGQQNRNRDAQDLFGENSNRNTSSQAPSLRARQRIGFDVPRVQVDRRQSQLQSRFSKLTDRHMGIKGVTVVADAAGTVVLQGNVPSAAAAKLAEKLVRLEPGVSSVRSELSYPEIPAN